MRIVVVLAVLAVVVAIGFIFGKRHARRFQRSRRIRIDRFKLKRRHADIELEVFGSREIVEAIQHYARDHHVSTEEAMRQAKVYLREIVPKFNLLAYYTFGQPIARAIMYFLYRPVVERKPLADFNETAPKGSTVVYIINHRSNADYVLVAHMLFKFVSLSYAVGEWARVWPLNHLFKWFGGYFVRRRYREPLYHAVLSKFVQTITKHGVTQGIFIEGGLTRDGAFQKPKLGMLDYIVTAKRDPSFDAPLFIIPTSINYDRVLEDRNLTDEEIIAAMDGYRAEWRDRVWLLREKTGAEIWKLAKKILELRHLIEPAERWRSDLFDGSGVPVIEEAWQWNPSERLLRDYYASSLLTFADVKRRGWPERPKDRREIEAQAARAAALKV